MRIVVRGANWIGDAVMTIPAMRRLRSAFPDASITLYTRLWAEGVFRDADFIDEIVPIAGGGSRVASVLAQARQLKKLDFDLAVIFPNSFESALVTKLAGIPKRLGYSTQKRGMLLTDRVATPDWKNERHESFYYLNLIESVSGPFHGEIDSSLNVSPDRRDAARESLNEKLGDASGPVVAFGPGSTNSLAKRWPAASFAALADLLASNANARIVLMGSAGEADVSAAVGNAAKTKPVDLTGATDLAEATAILSAVDLFVSNDMGLAHIAAAVGTPTIVIFGPTNEATTRPLGENVAIVREPVECSPCMLRMCPIDHRCMTRISPERVFESAIKMLETRTR